MMEINQLFKIKSMLQICLNLKHEESDFSKNSNTSTITKILDSGASVSMSGHKEMSINIIHDPLIMVEVADGTMVPAGGIGTLHLSLPGGSYVDMRGALHVLAVSLTLISVAHMTNSNHLVCFSHDFAYLLERYDGITEKDILIGYQSQGLYIIDDDPGMKTNFINYSTKLTTTEYKLNMIDKKSKCQCSLW
jgi:hypothetical protein